MRLTPREQEIREQFFPALPDLETKQLLNQSSIKTMAPGEHITDQDSPVPALYMITQGEVDIELDGSIVSSCRPGDYIGEISYISNSAASATTIAKTPVELICFEKNKLATLVNNSEKLRWLVHSVISENLVKKLILQNNAHLANCRAL